jgi:hypothetical protein
MLSDSKPSSLLRENPRRGGRQQPHHSLKKFKKYKEGKKRHTISFGFSGSQSILTLKKNIL